MAQEVIIRPEYLTSDKELKEQGYVFPDWEQDHKMVIEMIQNAFPNMRVSGCEVSLGIFTALDDADPEELKYISKIVGKTDDGKDMYEVALIQFHTMHGAGGHLRDNIRIFTNYPGNRRVFANVDWDEKIDYSLDWNRSIINRKATIHKDTVENIIDHLKKQLK
jgi:hypothetical protein